MPVTIVDVAKRARVSIGSVSNVLNNKAIVSPKLRDRVLVAIQELEYRPLRGSGSGQRDSTPTVAFVLSNRGMSDPFHSRVLQGVSLECEARGVFVIFATLYYEASQEPTAIRIPAVIRNEGMAHCVILGGANYPNLCNVMDEMGLKYVMQANNFADPDTPMPFDHVRYDDVKAACEVTQYLVDLGHKDIWYIGDISKRWFRNRHIGYQKTMLANGLEPRAHTAAVSDIRFTNGQRLTENILRQKQPVTAIFAGTDEVALGAMEAIRRHGLHSPEDISVVGFDDQYGMERGINLTSARIDMEQIGRELARLAISSIRSEDPREPQSVMVPITLIKRDTCQPPKLA